MAKWIALVALCVNRLFHSGCVKANGVLLSDMVKNVNGSNASVAWAFSLQGGLSCILGTLMDIC